LGKGKEEGLLLIVESFLFPEREARSREKTKKDQKRDLKDLEEKEKE